MSRKCTTCNIEVLVFKDHVKEEWHTYNLRRQTVGLGALTQEAFAKKQADLVVAPVQYKEVRCCGKSYKSAASLDNHRRSKKHLDTNQEVFEVIKDEEEREGEEMEADNDEEENDEIVIDGDCVEVLETDSEMDDEDEDEYVEVPLTIADCLFCNHSSVDLATNLVHMKSVHQFTFPYPDFLKDESGLMGYLINLIDTYHVCLKCDKQFYDRLSVRNHMLDRNHAQINVHLDNNADVLVEFYHIIPQPLSNLDSTLAEVQLPNGKMIGNRLCFKYFKQNLNGLSNTGQLAITSGLEKAKMSLIHVGRVQSLAKPGLLSHTEKKIKSKEARYRQYRASRFSNFQAHYRHQILM